MTPLFPGNKCPRYWARPDTGVNPNPPPHRFQGHEVREGDLVSERPGVWARVRAKRWACIVTKGVPTQLIDVLENGKVVLYRLFDVQEAAAEDLT